MLQGLFVLICLFAWSAQSQTLPVSIPGFHAVSDVTGSFDGRRVLFAGTRTRGAEPQIFEFEPSTGKVRQITRLSGGATQPRYQSRIFTLDAPEPWDQAVFVHRGQLHSCRLDGSSCGQITFHPGTVASPEVLWDGRVAYVVEGRIYSINADGSDVAMLSGEPARRILGATTAELFFESPAGLKRLSLLRPLLPALPASASSVPVRLLKPRTPPDGRGSSVEPGSATGALYCLTAGAGARVRVVTPSGASPGSAPIEADQSFHIRIPADTPIAVETLDERGNAIRRSGWFWVRGKENRGCIGCHENPESTPPNRFVKALSRAASELEK